MNQKELFIISLTIFLTVIIWIIADLNHLSHTEQLPKNDPRFARPITATIDTEIFNQLEAKN
ncbi:hypothetical protein A3B02_00270 [Candidatus Roizmanbacteria bacterium RIFCSPLOWO2_01_FULL_42_14]|uniref:Uncharacterized protein n=4 Tax=Candidatus Roizmaniibacteriota TaxID=1752723 RepID=A0A1F7K1A9_9BACT|nr:MAG: hypothetical protein A3D08_01085 [Candidatus Roizmanbacteria bacterium RIFCSPHIGHO2_02_FULL_43_11]OGK38238.1 MAG: hypothetical protein A3F32_00535 [Candidatus Roizmanbacteria bacterium RIFCSPHIGHO2_12_FULL_42_10]OGK51441.1 MAG: hypothetical protein A3B02_00270 [Candidatus Roizmanbacteria bacterium RIFCSPLOWO2_01_FULL_42_14]OGK61646.1 MAG: hypothetical protein A3I56_05005 [Candidatus Roizmanbacteria bacterium RIFCSPLOWO2_02_FULL_43_10]